MYKIIRENDVTITVQVDYETYKLKSNLIRIAFAINPNKNFIFMSIIKGPGIPSQVTISKKELEYYR